MGNGIYALTIATQCHKYTISSLLRLSNELEFMHNTMTDTTAQALLSLVSPAFSAEPLFDRMTDTVFFIKDAVGHYVCVNHTLVARCGKTHKSQVIGKTPSRLFGDELGGAFESQDKAIIANGEPLTDRLELHLRPGGGTGWCLTTKVPLLADDGRPIGIAGISRDLARPDDLSDDYHLLSEAISFAQRRVDKPPSLRELAEIAGMSVYRLDRRMRLLFGLTTGQWLLKNRIEFACHALRHGSRPIAEIALACGYSDQSCFTRQFRRTTAHTPSEFRRLTQRENR